MSSTFWIILGFGLALPSTFMLAVTILAKVFNGDNYTINTTKVGILYVTTLLGWAMILGLK